MDKLQIYLLMLVLIIPIIAYIRIQMNYSKYKKVILNSRLSGFEVARKILDENNLTELHIVEIKGVMVDHYDSSRKVLRLSSNTFNGESICSAAIAAHECGHAIQDSTNYGFLKFRNKITPTINICSKVAYVLIVVSILLTAINLFYIGLGLMLFNVVFQLITLPIEFDATKRAEEQLIKWNIVSAEEISGVKYMLSAAAFTYVANALASLLQIIRLFLSTRD